MMRDGDVKWVPVRTAAKLLRVSMKRVYQLIEQGTLTSMKVDCTVLVSMRSVESRQIVLPGVKDAAA